MTPEHFPSLLMLALAFGLSLLAWIPRRRTSRRPLSQLPAEPNGFSARFPRRQTRPFCTPCAEPKHRTIGGGRCPSCRA